MQLRREVNPDSSGSLVFRSEKITSSFARGFFMQLRREVNPDPSGSLVFRSEKITSSFTGGFFMPNSNRPFRCLILPLAVLGLVEISEQTNSLLM